MKILCGYNVNIDSVYSISGKEVSDLLNSQNTNQITAKVKTSPNVINSISDFVAGLVLCMQNGTGAEWLIHEKSVFDFLKNHFFRESIIRMGGNAGIMANVLSEMGADLVIPNVAIPSGTQVSLFSKKSIMVPKYKESSYEFNDELVHFVFDFKKGDTFSFDGNSVTIPRENRFIATYDRANIELAVNPNFETYAFEHIDEIDGILLSGFHMLMDTYSDGSTYVEKLENAVKQVVSWKTLNHNLMIHAEFGHFLNSDIGYSVFSKLAKHVDCIGMNEDELAMLSVMYGVPSKCILQMDACSTMDAMIRCASEFGVKRMIIHTREFVLSACVADLADSALELESMVFGLKCAATFAATGKLESREFVDKEASALNESVFGTAQVKELREYITGKQYGSGVAGEYKGYMVCILPTILCANPIATVGLGDTFSSATFLRELELHKIHV